MIYFQFILALIFFFWNSVVPYHFYLWHTFKELMLRISPEFEHILLFQCFQFFWELTNHPLLSGDLHSSLICLKNRLVTCLYIVMKNVQKIYLVIHSVIFFITIKHNWMKQKLKWWHVLRICIDQIPHVRLLWHVDDILPHPKHSTFLYYGFITLHVLVFLHVNCSRSNFRFPGLKCFGFFFSFFGNITHRWGN